MSVTKIIVETGKWAWKNKETILVSVEGAKMAGKWIKNKIKKK